MPQALSQSYLDPSCYIKSNNGCQIYTINPGVYQTWMGVKFGLLICVEVGRWVVSWVVRGCVFVVVSVRG